MRTFSLEQISFVQQIYKIDLRARYMEIESVNQKSGQSEIAKEMGMSSSTLQRYRHDFKMQSVYKSNTIKGTQKTLIDLKIPQMTL